MVNAGAALVQIAGDRRVGRRRFEQLERRLPHRDEMRAHFLRRHVLWRLDLEPERIAIERQRGSQVLDGNANVIECGLHFNVLRRISSAAEYGSTFRAAMRSTIDCNSPGASTFCST